MDHSTKRSSVFNPPHQLIQREDEEILFADLTGFQKEQLKIKVKRANRKVIISGERPAADRRRRIRLHKEFKVPDHCSMRGISAWLDDGVLYLVMPKLSRKASRKDTSAAKPMQQRLEQEPEREESDAANRAPDKEDDHEDEEEEARLNELEIEEREFRSMDENMGAPEGGATRSGGGRRPGKWRLELRRWQLKLKLGAFDCELSRVRELALTLVVVVAVSMGLGLYLQYYRRSEEL